jgi:hypothetical protein
MTVQNRVSPAAAQSPVARANPSPESLHALFFITYIVLFSMLVLAARSLGRPIPPEFTGLDVVLLCLATFRLTEVITEEKVARFIRAPFCVRKKMIGADGKESFEEEPCGAGVRRVIGELVLCPWCTGIWIASTLTFLYVFTPDVARVVLLAFGVAAGGMLFQILAKLMDRVRTSIPE